MEQALQMLKKIADLLECDPEIAETAITHEGTNWIDLAIIPMTGECITIGWSE